MTRTLNISSIILVLLFGVFLNGNIARAAGFTFTRDITLGSRGADVSALQQILIDGGFLKISTPTGYFGPLTKSTLSVWQTSMGISPASGYFGPISRKKIGATLSQTTTTITTVTTTTITNTVTGCTSLIGFSPTTGTPCGGPATTTAAAVTPEIITTSVPTTSTSNGSPIHLKIPRINVDASFQYNGLKADGTMEIPNNVVDVGWFTGSVRPGEKGTSVITGHVAQIRGGVVTKPGVFFNLKDLSVGDTLAVVNDKGETISFVVRAVRNYDPSADATDVFSANDNGAHMNIITCEGTWHPDQLSYSQRLVVFTDAL